MTHTLCLSGGKDSTALLLLLLQDHLPLDRIIIIDGGWEFPEARPHLDRLQALTPIPFEIIRPTHSFTHYLLHHPVQHVTGEKKGLIKHIGYGWPAWNRRWCTTMKTRLIDAAIGKGNHRYIGIAADEMHRVGKTKRDAHIYPESYPLIEAGLTEADCLKMCYDAGYTWDGLYNHVKRLSCFCCPISSLQTLRYVYTKHHALWELMMTWDRSMPHKTRFMNSRTLQDIDTKFYAEQCQLSLKSMPKSV